MENMLLSRQNSDENLFTVHVCINTVHIITMGDQLDELYSFSGSLPYSDLSKFVLANIIWLMIDWLIKRCCVKQLARQIQQIVNTYVTKISKYYYNAIYFWSIFGCENTATMCMKHNVVCRCFDDKHAYRPTLADNAILILWWLRSVQRDWSVLPADDWLTCVWRRAFDTLHRPPYYNYATVVDGSLDYKLRFNEKQTQLFLTNRATHLSSMQCFSSVCCFCEILDSAGL